MRPKFTTETALAATMKLSEKKLIAIDGRPASGKTTIALSLAQKIGAQTLHLDEFFLPKSLWPKEIAPGVPFPFFRFSEFTRCVEALADGREFAYYCYDFHTDDYEAIPTIIKPLFPIIIEGCSVLAPQVERLYSTRIYVQSDEPSEFAAISKREHNTNLTIWRDLYLPSVEIYNKTQPWERADCIYVGRHSTPQ